MKKDANIHTLEHVKSSNRGSISLALSSTNFLNISSHRAVNEGKWYLASKQGRKHLEITQLGTQESKLVLGMGRRISSEAHL